MRAVILAGGRGTRLHPLTTNVPKPLVPMFDKPVMEHTVTLLAKHGIRDITVTVSYRADQIMERFGDGSRLGVNIDYYIEETPRGTAGGLKDFADKLTETFLVISGDAVTDFDLTSALEFHRSRRAKATLAMYDVPDPSQFGLVQTDPSGRILRFVEKPSPNEVFGNTVNTGIYVLDPSVVDLIPENAAFDFSRDLFPRLLKQPNSLWARKMDGYWCDVGNLGQYRDAHFDALSGQAKIGIPGAKIAGGVWVGRDCEIHPTARVCSPIYLGSGTRVGPNAFIGGYAVIGKGSLIGENAKIAQSIIGHGASVAPNSAVFGSVIGDGHRLEDSVNVANRIVVTEGLEREIVPARDLRLIEDVTMSMQHHLWGHFQQAITAAFAQPAPSAA